MNNTNNNGNNINKSKETSGLKNDTKSNKSNSNGTHKHNKNTSKQNVKVHQNSTSSSSNNSSTNANHQTATNNNNKQNAKQNDEEQDMIGKTMRTSNRSKSESETVNKGGKGYFQHTVAGGFSKETHTRMHNKQTNKPIHTKVFELINEIIEKDSTNNPESIKRTVSKTAVVSVQNITNENGMHEATAPQTADFEIELANNYMSKVKKVFYTLICFYFNFLILFKMKEQTSWRSER